MFLISTPQGQVSTVKVRLSVHQAKPPQLTQVSVALSDKVYMYFYST